MSTEVWKPIENYQGYYSVSNLGRIRSEERVVPHKRSGSKTIREKILAPGLNRHGYLLAYLTQNGVKKTMKIHRLVAEAFLDNPNNLPAVNHKNGLKIDNSVDNLEWCSFAANNQHAYDSGLKKAAKGSKNGLAKLTELDVELIREMVSIWKMQQKEIAKLFGVGKSAICKIVNRQNWSHI